MRQGAPLHHYHMPWHSPMPQWSATQDAPRSASELLLHTCVLKPLPQHSFLRWQQVLTAAATPSLHPILLRTVQCDHCSAHATLHTTKGPVGLHSPQAYPNLTRSCKQTYCQANIPSTVKHCQRRRQTIHLRHAPTFRYQALYQVKPYACYKSSIQ